MAFRFWHFVLLGLSCGSLQIDTVTAQQKYTQPVPDNHQFGFVSANAPVFGVKQPTARTKPRQFMVRVATVFSCCAFAFSLHFDAELFNFVFVAICGDAVI